MKFIWRFFLNSQAQDVSGKNEHLRRHHGAGPNAAASALGRPWVNVKQILVQSKYHQNCLQYMNQRLQSDNEKTKRTALKQTSQLTVREVMINSRKSHTSKVEGLDLATPAKVVLTFYDRFA